MLDILLAIALIAQADPAAQTTPSSQTAQSPAVGNKTFISVPSREAQKHLVGEWPALRLSSAKDRGTFFSGIKVAVTVDTHGAILSAVASREVDGEAKVPPQAFEEAEAVVRDLHYTPFERGGRPVAVKFDQYVGLLPPEITPARHIPFPKVKDLKAIRISFERTACLGSCPAYSVTVTGDGSVSYEGRYQVAFLGAHRGSVSAHNAVELLRLFEEADFFSLNDEYRMGFSDAATRTITIEIDGRRKSVVDYVGLEAGMPLSVANLETAIDRLSGVERWTHGNAETLGGLQAENWDFKSPEAAATLVRVIQKGDASVVRDLVASGVPLHGNEELGPALVEAGYRGNPVMVQALLKAGAAADLPALDIALVVAASAGKVESFRLLLNSGARKDARDSYGRTLLMAAAASGSPEMVKEVLRLKPDVNAASQLPNGPENDRDRSQEGFTALMAAVSSRDYDVPPEGVDRIEVVRLLLQSGANPNLRNHDGDTALIFCANSTDMALLLIKAGADVNVEDNQGRTALSNTYDKDLQRVLREHGAIGKAADEK